MLQNFDSSNGKSRNHTKYDFYFYRGLALFTSPLFAGNNFADFIVKLRKVYDSCVTTNVDFWESHQVKLGFSGELLVRPNTFIRTAKIISYQLSLREVAKTIESTWLYPSTDKLIVENEFDLMVWRTLYLHDIQVDYTPEVVALKVLKERYGNVLPIPPHNVYQHFFSEMLQMADVRIHPCQITRIVGTVDGVWGTLFDDAVSICPFTPYITIMRRSR